MYESIWVESNNNDNDIKCDVCQDKDPYPNCEIICCDYCNVAVHQSCYGREIIYKIP